MVHIPISHFYICAYRSKISIYIKYLGKNEFTYKNQISMFLLTYIGMCKNYEFHRHKLCNCGLVGQYFRFIFATGLKQILLGVGFEGWEDCCYFLFTLSSVSHGFEVKTGLEL